MAGSALKAMVSFFTIWQQDITQEDMDAMDSNFHLAPVVGALIGLVVLIEAAVLGLLTVHGVYGSSIFTAAVLLATVYAGSRFLHFDGLADFGDGSIVAGTREDHIRALKDTLIGAGGLGVALIVTLLNFAEYATAGIFIIVMAPVVEILVKNSQVVAAAYGLPSNGMAGKQVRETNGRSLVRSCIISLILVILFSIIGAIVGGLVYGHSFFYPMDAVFVALFGLAVSIVVGYVMAIHSNKVFGMVNGDILGATHEICRVAAMLVMSIAYGLFV